MRKQCKRIKRDPYLCISKRMGLVKSQAVDLGCAYFTALDALMGDRGTEQQWATLACAINVALLLAERGINAEALQIIKLAQEGLMAIRRHAQAHGVWSANIAHHLKQAILAAVNAHDLQCGIATKAQLSEALREVHRRVEQGEVLV